MTWFPKTNLFVFLEQIIRPRYIFCTQLHIITTAIFEIAVFFSIPFKESVVHLSKTKYNVSNQQYKMPKQTIHKKKVLQKQRLR